MLEMAFNPRLVRFQNILQRGSERKPRASIGVCHLEQTWRVGLDHLRAVEASWGNQGGLGSRKGKGRKWNRSGFPGRQSFYIMETSQLLEPTDEGRRPATYLFHDLLRLT